MRNSPREQRIRGYARNFAGIYIFYAKFTISDDVYLLLSALWAGLQKDDTGILVP